MFAIGFIYTAFGSHLFYLLAEKGFRFYKTHTFWQLLIGLLFTAYLTKIMYQ